MTRAIAILKERKELLILLLIIALATLLRLAFLHEPFERDEGQYAAIAREILRGGLPYRDAIEIKPPGTFYLYALALWLFGATVEGVRLFTALYAAMTVITVFTFARRLAGSTAGLAAAGLFGIISTIPLLHGSGSNTEVFLILPLTLSALMCMVALETGVRGHFALSGLLAGLAMLIKTVALPVLLLEMTVIMLPRSHRRPWRESAGDLASFVLPVLAVGLAVLAGFAAKGGLGDFIYWNITFPATYRNSRVTGPPLLTVLYHLLPALAVPLFLTCCSLPRFWHNRRNHTELFTLLLVPAACCTVAMPGKYFPHYFINLLPFLAITAGIGLVHAQGLSRGWRFGINTAAAAGLLFMTLVTYPYYTQFTPEQVSTIKYGSIFVESAEAARYLKERTSPDDYIFQWGLEPEIYFLADRRPPVPYITSVTVEWSRDPDQARARLLEGLLTKRPKYIVVQEGVWSEWAGLDEVLGVLDQHYVPDRPLPFGYIARRRDLPAIP